MSKWRSKQQGFLEVYYVATIVRVLWLAAKRERFSCNDRALLARCARHIKSVFNLIVNIHVMVNWQLSNAKRVSADQCHMTVSRAQVYNSLRWIQLRCFFSVMTERTSGGQGRDSVEKSFLETEFPPYLRVWMTGTPIISRYGFGTADEVKNSKTISTSKLNSEEVISY